MKLLENKLKPCPFCGGDDFIVIELTLFSHEAGRLKIECRNCGTIFELEGGAVAQTSDGYLRLGPDAIEKWNRRAGK